MTSHFRVRRSTSVRGIFPGLRSFLGIPIALTIAVFLASCSDSNPSNPPVINDHGVATTLELTFVKKRPDGTLSDDSARVLVRDTTVVRGKPAVEGLLLLDDSSTFFCRVRLYDESRSPRLEITSEIENEKDGHLFVYTPKNGLDLSHLKITGLDKDSKGMDVGLTFSAETGDGARSGALNVKLRHFDGNDKTDPRYDTDIDRDLPVTIK